MIIGSFFFYVLHQNPKEYWKFSKNSCKCFLTMLQCSHYPEGGNE